MWISPRGRKNVFCRPHSVDVHAINPSFHTFSGTVIAGRVRNIMNPLASKHMTERIIAGDILRTNAEVFDEEFKAPNIVAPTTFPIFRAEAIRPEALLASCLLTDASIELAVEGTGFSCRNRRYEWSRRGNNLSTTKYCCHIHRVKVPPTAH